MITKKAPFLAYTLVLAAMVAALLPAGCVGSKVAGDGADGTYFTDPRDNHRYRTVKIGEQVWMAENLNFITAGTPMWVPKSVYSYYSGSGDSVLYVKPTSYCYGDKKSNCAKYGRLYDWKGAQAACPAGWHLPTTVDWGRLVDAAGGDEVAGKALKSTTGWNNDAKGRSGNGTDEFGFSALPSGRGPLNDGSFDDIGDEANWWSATETALGGVYGRFMYSDSDSVGRGFHGHEHGHAVRCVKDGDNNVASEVVSDVEIEIKAGSFTDPRDERQYRTVDIGKLTWMAENLNFETGASWCYDDDESNCQKYGRLYDRPTALKACPSGWYLPSEREWQHLDDAAFGAIEELESKAGKRMPEGKINKETTYSGFSALSGGARDYEDGRYHGIGTIGRWWSAKERKGGSYVPYYYTEMWEDGGVDGDYMLVPSSTDTQKDGFSVRCVRGRGGD